jgi:hypothetical protein
VLHAAEGWVPAMTLGGPLRKSEWVVLIATVIVWVWAWYAESQRPDPVRMQERRSAPALVDPDIPL